MLTSATRFGIFGSLMTSRYHANHGVRSKGSVKNAMPLWRYPSTLASVPARVRALCQLRTLTHTYVHAGSMKRFMAIKIQNMTLTDIEQSRFAVQGVGSKPKNGTKYTLRNEAGLSS